MEKLLRPLGFAISIGVHLFVLFYVSTSVSVKQKAQYAMQNVTSSEVELVVPKATEAPLVKPDEFAHAKPNKIKPKAEPPPPLPPPPKEPPPARPPALLGATKTTTKGPVSARPDYLRNPPPPYPEESLAKHEEGIVLLLVDVGADGSALDVRIKKSSGFKKLDDAAMLTVKTWKFKPSTLDGAPVKSEVEVPVHYKLPKEDD
jgi:protein TonB